MGPTIAKRSELREADGRWCELRVELREGPQGPTLSICGATGEVAARRPAGAEVHHRDGARVFLVTASGQIPDAIARFFPEAAPFLPWHLNHMHAGCVHQDAEGWGQRPIDPDKPLRAYGRHFPGQRQDSCNMLTWVRRAEHPQGLLGEPCPTCGYEFGTAWTYRALPAEVVAWAKGEPAPEVSTADRPVVCGVRAPLSPSSPEAWWVEEAGRRGLTVAELKEQVRLADERLERS